MGDQFLVALLKERSDFEILRQQSWYRIPVASRPKRWPPDYLGFYQPAAFGADAFCIRYFASISNISIASRSELFPNTPWGEKADKQYFRLEIESLEELPRPIPSRFARRVVFIPTTREKFFSAEQLNDLYDESPLEDLIWSSLKSSQIPAERQWLEQVGENYYQLDFAIFCNQGKIDVEADGDSWHARKERISQDNDRNNDLGKTGWHILRFNRKQINEAGAGYLTKVKQTINRLDGLVEDGLVGRKFVENDGDTAQQLNLF